MFNDMFRIVNGPDGRHLYVHTDSMPVAILLVIALLVTILLSSALCYYITRFILLKIVGHLARGERRKWLRAAERRKVFHRLAPLVPAVIIYVSAPLLTGVSFPIISALGRPVETLSACFMVVTVLRAAFAFLGSIEDRYSHFPFASQRPIKSFLQIAAIVLYVLALIAAAPVASQFPHRRERDDCTPDHHLPRFAAGFCRQHSTGCIRHAARR
jgi:miniconductance mechanosensitive channel